MKRAWKQIAAGLLAAAVLIPTTSSAAMNAHRKGLGANSPQPSGVSQLFTVDAASWHNTWVFTGGRAVQGSFEDVQGARNYASEFEDCIRGGGLPTGWTGGTGPGQQRYVISTAYTGQTLADVLAGFDQRIAPCRPRAVAYMIGPEDYCAGAAGLNDFRVNLQAFISRVLALEDGQGVAVIQTPYALQTDLPETGMTNANAQMYAQAANIIISTNFTRWGSSGRIQLVDHFQLTRWSPAFLSTLNQQGYPNGRGHLMLAEQLAAALCGTVAAFPSSSAQTKAPISDAYPNDGLLVSAQYLAGSVPRAISGADSLSVTLPQGLEGGDWRYTLELKEQGQLRYTVSGTAPASFTVPGLTGGGTYLLSITSGDGSKVLPALSGVISAGAAGTVYDRAEPVPALKRKLDAGAMTWLFMGDSLFHGCVWLQGYDSVTQSFEKFLKDDLGRKTDIVVNTAVSGSTSALTVQYLEDRLTRYSPDAVVIMLGTNDALGKDSAVVPVGSYKNNLRAMIDAALEKGAVPVLCTPVANANRTDGGAPAVRLPDYVKAVRELAAEYQGRVLLVDFNRVWQAYMLQSDGVCQPSVYASLLFIDPAITHPNTLGHLWMTRLLIDTLGLWRADSRIYRLRGSSTMQAVDASGTVAHLDGAVSVDGETRTVTLSTTALAALWQGNHFCEASITVQGKESGLRYCAAALRGEDAVVGHIPGDELAYTVTVSALRADRAERVTFPPLEILLPR